MHNNFSQNTLSHCRWKWLYIPLSRLLALLQIIQIFIDFIPQAYVHAIQYPEANTGCHFYINSTLGKYRLPFLHQLNPRQTSAASFTPTQRPSITGCHFQVSSIPNKHRLPFLRQLNPRQTPAAIFTSTQQRQTNFNTNFSSEA